MRQSVDIVYAWQTTGEYVANALDANDLQVAVQVDMYMPVPGILPFACFA